jgi:hypothetical protein
MSSRIKSPTPSLEYCGKLSSIKREVPQFTPMPKFKNDPIEECLARKTLGASTQAHIQHFRKRRALRLLMRTHAMTPSDVIAVSGTRKMYQDAETSKRRNAAMGIASGLIRVFLADGAS